MESERLMELEIRRDERKQRKVETLKEAFIETHFCKVVKIYGGGTRKIQYVNRRGASDRLTALKGALYIVELKRPKGGVVSVHQSEDAKFWAAVYVTKVYLWTIPMVDRWVQSVCSGAKP
jgi:hypothetical protein